MIDLHCHILPGIDDGPWSLPEAVEMADAVWDDGVDTVAATPHLRADFPGVRVEEIAGRCAEFNRLLADVSIGLEIVPGAEVDLTWALDATPEQLRAASYGGLGEYVLVETPYGGLPETFEDLLFQAVPARGMRVVLAHPERNRSFRRHPERLRALVDEGVLVQVTAPGLIKRDRRSRSRTFALSLIEDGLCHLLASDAHSAGPKRGPCLSEAANQAAEVAPIRTAWMMDEMAPAVLAGEPPPRPPSTERRRRLLGGSRS